MDRFLNLQAIAGLYAPWLIKGNVGGRAGEAQPPQRGVQDVVLRRCELPPSAGACARRAVVVPLRSWAWLAATASPRRTSARPSPWV